MGWTYAIESKGGVDLIDDMIFDRESLGKFMGLTHEQYKEINADGQTTITLQHVDNAIKFLTDFNKRILSMPFDEGEGKEAYKILRTHTDESGIRYAVVDADNNAVYDYVGSPNNIAIFKEVEKVLAREYHFRYPWDKRKYSYEDDDLGVNYMIRALEDTKSRMKDMNINEAWLICY